MKGVQLGGKGNLYGLQSFRHQFSGKCTFYRLENFNRNRGGSEVEFWSDVFFDVGSSRDYKKSRE